jgi:ABC-2 type transport system permease protein
MPEGQLLPSGDSRPVALPMGVKTLTKYLDGIKDVRTFDLFGSTLMGFIIFLFVFLVAGMSFLKERKSGTLEKLLSTPIRRREIVLGYVCGFGALTILQSAVISIYIIKVLGVIMNGSIWFMLLINLLAAVCALTLGMLLSTAANSEFQMMQFVPIVVIPQLFFSGLFDLSEGWMIFGRIMPLTYIADALNKIMFRNAGVGEFYVDVLVLVGFSAFFMILNTILLKRYRRI